jgi:beta-barrel assembly-enhancing protease
MKGIFIYTAMVLVIISMLLASCNKEDKSINVFTVQDDINLGLKVSQEIDSDTVNYPILDESKYPEAYQHVRRIRDAILATGKVRFKDEFAWDVKIIDDTVLNAFCVPGGYLYFYKGLINYLDNESQFAGVMAHEMAHAARRHSTDQLTKAYGLSVLFGVLLGENPGLIADIASKLLVLKFSRSNEFEADEYSVIYLYDTEYDARGTAGFFEKLMAGEQGGASIPFLSTHPSDQERITKIYEKWQALGGKEGGTFDSRYQDFKNSLPK